MSYRQGLYGVSSGLKNFRRKKRSLNKDWLGKKVKANIEETLV
jgi:hypothetical protein